MTDTAPHDAVSYPLAIDANGPDILPDAAAWVAENHGFLVVPIGSGKYVIVSQLPMDLTPEYREKLVRFLGGTP